MRLPNSRTRNRVGVVSRNRDGRSTARFVGRRAWWLPGRLDRRSLRSDSIFAASPLCGGGERLRLLECSEVVGQWDGAERKRAKCLRWLARKEARTAFQPAARCFFPLPYEKGQAGPPNHIRTVDSSWGCEHRRRFTQSMPI
jgi:hypothetical protein